MRAFARAASASFPDEDVDMLEVGGGVALWMWPGSPLNQACGLGFAAPVEPEDVEQLESFYAVRGARGAMSVCPLADSSLFAALARLGWTPSGFENVLVLGLDGVDQPGGAPDDTPAGVSIVEARSADERAVWAQAVTDGFSAPDDPSEAEVRLGRAIASREGVTLLLALVDGTPAGTGELSVDDGVGWLAADTTLPEFRGRGIQSALQRERLRRAAAAGCDIAVIESAPGSASQRNMERNGFAVAYTRVDVRAPHL